MHRVEIYIRCPDCELCGKEMNPGREHYWQGRELCIRCYEEVKEGEQHAG